uniref:Methyltransferase n=1 Tax=viral metagenome TaxID=1070528 RepID=A0A6C0K3N0_9ZZZZ
MEALQNIVELAFENAEKGISKITDDILKMDGMSGKKTRHFYNNLLNTTDARYLEIGCWKGSSVCSAMCGNKATVVCIDNWSQFGGPKEEFLINFLKYKGENNASFIEQDCFQVDIKTLPKFNIFMYDGDHASDSHNRALLHYYECLDDIFIYVVDDWIHPDIREGTYLSIIHLNLTVLYSKEIRCECAETWWNGIFVAILKKRSS